MPIPDIEKAFEKLKYAGNPVFNGKVNSELLFFGNKRSTSYYESVYNTNEPYNILFEPIVEEHLVADSLNLDSPALYSTHPTIESRIIQINSILPEDSLFTEKILNDEFSSIRNLGIILYARKLLDDGNYIEALYTSVKAREVILDSEEIAKIQLKSMLLIAQDKYTPHYMSNLINNYGPECIQQDFLKFKKSILSIPALEMNLIFDYALNDSKTYFSNGYSYIDRLQQFSDQFLYKNNPFLFSVKNSTYQFDSISYLQIKPVSNLKTYYTEDEIDNMNELINDCLLYTSPSPRDDR